MIASFEGLRAVLIFMFVFTYVNWGNGSKLLGHELNVGNEILLGSVCTKMKGDGCYYYSIDNGWGLIIV